MVEESCKLPNLVKKSVKKRTTQKCLKITKVGRKLDERKETSNEVDQKGRQPQRKATSQEDEPANL